MKRLLSSMLALALWSSPVSASFIYDFPGAPGSGLAINQSTPQSANVIFSDFTRTTIAATAAAGIFESDLWNNSSVFDATQYYASFSITAENGFTLALNGVTFDTSRTSGGPTKGRVLVFLNGSSTAYASYDWNPGNSIETKNFVFNPVTASHNVTLVEFRFYGWNGGSPGGALMFDNVMAQVSLVPEASTWLISLLPLALIASRFVRRHFGRPSAARARLV